MFHVKQKNIANHSKYIRYSNFFKNDKRRVYKFKNELRYLYFKQFILNNKIENLIDSKLPRSNFLIQQ